MRSHILLAANADAVMAHVYPWLLLWTLTLLFADCSKNLVEKCFQTHIDTITPLKVDPQYLQALKSHLDSLQKPRRDLHDGSRLVLDLSLSSPEPPLVFHHMLQLNVSGVDEVGKSIFHCKYDTVRNLDKAKLDHILSGGSLVYVNARNLQPSTGYVSWLTLLALHPKTRVLMNDVPDEEYFNYQRAPSCRTVSGVKVLPDHCYVPLLPLGGLYNRKLVPGRSLAALQLSNWSLERLQRYLGAFRDLAACVAPAPGQRFTFQLSQTTAAEYWRDLSQFLGTPLTPQKARLLEEGGLTAPLVDSPKQHLEVVPNICHHHHHQRKSQAGSAAGIGTASATTASSHISEAKLLVCASRYADEIGRIFGPQFRDLVYDRLTAPSRFVRRVPASAAAARRLILGIGPGTTGTTSLYTAARMLNITARHGTRYSQHCAEESEAARALRSGFDPPELGILSSQGGGGVEGPVFWADTPVNELWFPLLRQYPRTRIIMTDVREDVVIQWFKKRRRIKCYDGPKEGEHWGECTVPLAVGFYNGQSERSNEFYDNVHFVKTGMDLAEEAFAAYRQLVRCAVPEQQLWWVWINEHDSSPAFWDQFASFANVTLGAELRRALYLAGVPRVGSSGCKLGEYPCVFETEGRDSSAIVPSVCAMARKSADSVQ